MKLEIHIDPSCEELRVEITAPAMNDEARELLGRLESGAGGPLAGFREETVTLLEPETVLSFRTEGDRVLARTLEGDYAVRLRLYELEQKLDARRFVRISQSELVNLKQVRQLDLSLAGTIRMTLADGSSTFVSRRCVKKIKQALGLA